MNTFSGSAMIRAGWETFKKRPWFFIGAFLLAIVVQWILEVLLGEIGKQFGGAGKFIAGICNIVIGIFYSMGILNLSLIANENAEKAAFRDLWYPKPFWRFLGVSILVGIVLFIALIVSAIVGAIAAGIAHFIAAGAALPTFIVVCAILAIIATFYFSILFMFAKYLVITRALGPIGAMQESARITKVHRGQLLWLIILSMLVCLLGFICLIVGLLVAIPVVSFATVRAYRDLEQNASEPVPAA